VWPSLFTALPITMDRMLTLAILTLLIMAVSGATAARAPRTLVRLR